MIERLLQALFAQTLALSVAVAVARALQALVLRRLGAGAAYACWLLVPVAMLCAALPHAAADALVLRVDISAIAPAWAGGSLAAHASRTGMFASVAAAAWTAGALSLAIILALRQRRFDALVMRSDGVPARLPAGAGPAVIGVFRPRIALPLDFESAFDAEERRLVLLHEGVHLRRRDNAWNLLAGGLLVVHWFNPIAWWAYRRLRADQELACDAAVLRRESPLALNRYAGALLKVQGIVLNPPLATAWQSTHPLVERVRMLQVHRISSARHRAGLRVATLAVVLAGVGGYTLQAGAGALPMAVSASEASVMTAIEITQTSAQATAAEVAGTTSVDSKMKVLSRIGQEALIRIDGSPKLAPFEFGLTVSRLDGNRLDIAMRLRGGTPMALLGSPRLIVRNGDKASLSIDSGAAGTFAISLTPKMVEGGLAAAPQRAP